jgi:hypothetical protein
MCAKAKTREPKILDLVGVKAHKTTVRDPEGVTHEYDAFTTAVKLGRVDLNDPSSMERARHVLGDWTAGLDDSLVLVIATKIFDDSKVFVEEMEKKGVTFVASPPPMESQ